MWYGLAGSLVLSAALILLKDSYVLLYNVDQVYFILSLEELVRLLITLFIFRSRKWMMSLQADHESAGPE